MTSHIANTAARLATTGCRGQRRPHLIASGRAEPSASPAPMAIRERHRAVPPRTRPTWRHSR
jgi:hypothetical protein